MGEHEASPKHTQTPATGFRVWGYLNWGGGGGVDEPPQGFMAPCVFMEKGGGGS